MKLLSLAYWPLLPINDKALRPSTTMLHRGKNGCKIRRFSVVVSSYRSVDLISCQHVDVPACCSFSLLTMLVLSRWTCITYSCPVDKRSLGTINHLTSRASISQRINNQDFDYSAFDYSAIHLLHIYLHTATLKMSSRLGQFVKFYNANFERRPIPTLMITNSTLNTLADILAQSSQIYVSPPLQLN